MPVKCDLTLAKSNIQDVFQIYKQASEILVWLWRNCIKALTDSESPHDLLSLKRRAMSYKLYSAYVFTMKGAMNGDRVLQNEKSLSVKLSKQIQGNHIGGKQEINSLKVFFQFNKTETMKILHFIYTSWVHSLKSSKLNNITYLRSTASKTNNLNPWKNHTDVWID